MLTRANGLTIARAAISVTILVVAVVEQSPELLLLGLGCSLVLDFADGALARALKRETVLGAQLDGVADRLTVVLIAAGVVSMEPSAGVVVAATAVWVQFGMVDQLLTSQFLRFGLWSPDHFYELDPPEAEPRAERVWLLNWSAGAKLASNLPIILLAIGAWWAALCISVALIALRVPGYLSIKALAGDLPAPVTNGARRPTQPISSHRPRTTRPSRSGHRALR